MARVLGIKLGNMKGITINEVYQKIKEMIYNNQLAPGQKLIYSDIGRRLNVSNTPVIQALNRLEASCLVEYKPNKGYFIGEITETEARQLYQARKALEIYIIPTVIENIDARKLNDIKDEFNKYKETDRRGLILVDARFHLKIVENAQNEIIHKLLKDIFERIYLKYRPEYLGNTRTKQVIKEHRIILDALKKGDAEYAKAVTERHIEEGLRHVLGSLRTHRIPLF